MLGNGVWVHIAPQVAKKIVASIRPPARATLGQVLVDLCLVDDSVRVMSDEHGMRQNDVGSVVNSILSQQPVVAILMDAMSRDLRLWVSGKGAKSAAGRSERL